MNKFSLYEINIRVSMPLKIALARILFPNVRRVFDDSRVQALDALFLYALSGLKQKVFDGTR